MRTTKFTFILCLKLDDKFYTFMTISFFFSFHNVKKIKYLKCINFYIDKDPLNTQNTEYFKL